MYMYNYFNNLMGSYSHYNPQPNQNLMPFTNNFNKTKYIQTHQIIIHPDKNLTMNHQNH
jgi:hypothetical protein